MTSILFLPADVKTLTGIITYQHPTIVGKKNGPSALKEETLAIGGFYASRGFAVIFPNYLGFLNDTDPHPYSIYPQQTVRSIVTALNTLVEDGMFANYSNEFIPLHAVGYSEGASYSLWVSKCLSKPSECSFYNSSTIYTTNLTLN
jgi:hypothetical protein